MAAGVKSYAGALNPRVYDNGDGTFTDHPQPTVRKDLSAVAIGTIATVWTPASGKTIRLLGGSISVSAAVNVLLEDNAAGAGNFVFRTPKLLADTPYDFRLGDGVLLSAVDHLLKATSSAAANVTGTLWGTEE